MFTDKVCGPTVDEEHKTIRARLKLLDQPWTEEWGVDVTMGDEYIIFHQVYRDVYYRKAWVREMEFSYCEKPEAKGY